MDGGPSVLVAAFDLGDLLSNEAEIDRGFVLAAVSSCRNEFLSQ